jgi:hypothetical protein
MHVEVVLIRSSSSQQQLLLGLFQVYFLDKPKRNQEVSLWFRLRTTLYVVQVENVPLSSNITVGHRSMYLL